ncbi:MAG TPA: hypothetical protein VMD09_15755 [Solirubrobacteraceae bacterium]|nr:hypothetical protein [Solirubrobacteraceae bacterium]
MPNPMLSHLIADARMEEFRREAARASSRRPSDTTRHGAREAADVVLTIRLASAHDVKALKCLADLDSARVPSGAILVAEADGQLRAALSLKNGAAIADPFHPTAAIVELLSARAEQLCGKPRRPGFLARLRIIAGRTRRGSGARWGSAASLSGCR